MTSNSSSSSVFRSNGVSYFEIPAKDIQRSAEFYGKVFGWEIGGSPSNRSFTDGTGHVIDHWNIELPAVGQPGSSLTYSLKISTKL